MVVPAAIAVGWELSEADRVLVVSEVRPTTLVVIDSKTGKTEELPMLQENDATNSVEESGSELRPTDTTTPGLERDEDVDVAE